MKSANCLLIILLLTGDIGFSNSKKPDQPYKLNLYPNDNKLPEQISFNCSLQEKSKDQEWITKCRYKRLIVMNFKERIRYSAESGRVNINQVYKRCKKNRKLDDVAEKALCDAVNNLDNPNNATLNELIQVQNDMIENMIEEAKRKGKSVQPLEKLKSTCTVAFNEGKIAFKWDGARWIESGLYIDSCDFKYNASLWKKNGIWHFEKSFNKNLSTKYLWCKPQIEYYAGKKFHLTSSFSDPRSIDCKYFMIQDNLSGYNPIF